jgi:hypothetical protein
MPVLEDIKAIVLKNGFLKALLKEDKKMALLCKG